MKIFGKKIAIIGADIGKSTLAAKIAIASPTKEYPTEVLMIHNEFDTAADKLLEEANGILKKAEKADAVKVSRLESLGFKQASQIAEIKPLLQQAELSKEQIELVSYYKRNYPFNKFITENQVKTICHKYNLVCGDVSRFKGFVPEKNLKQIESFKIKDQDLNTLILTCKNTGENFFFNEKDFTNYGKRYCIREGNEFYVVDSNGKNIYDTYSLLTKECLKKFENRSSRFGISGRVEKNQNKLKICAPVKDMDITGLELSEGYKLVKKHIPDPVVLHPVKGGYLILTAWGDEASDPIVTNEINN